VEPDDDLDDAGSSGLLLPPDDRLWRHPSEAALLAGRPSTRHALYSRMWTVAILSGVIGALLATGTLYASGGLSTREVAVPALEHDVDLAPVITLASTGAPPDFMSGAERVQASCVTLVARDAHGTTTSIGMVFRSDGMVITPAHTVTGAESLTAIVGGTRHVGAHLVAWDAGSDLAVIKLDGSAYDPAPMGSALDLAVGDPIITLRAPTDGTVADDQAGDQGLIGALGQAIVSPAGTPLGDLLEVDTPSPPTTVGGALLDSHGAVVAISTALGGPDGTVEYATPVDLARQVATELLTTGRFVPVWLGVRGTDAAPAAAAALGVDGAAVISEVFPNSPAATAGLEDNDVVVGVNDQAITSMVGLITAVHASAPGSTVSLDLYRDGHERLISAVVAPRPTGIT